MKSSFRFVLFVSFLFGCLGGVKAQYATIPDPNFVIYLQNAGLGGCLNGNQLDTTCPAVMTKKKINCSGYDIADLTGIEYFDILDTLDCSGNPLEQFPVWPSTLRVLNCSGNEDWWGPFDPPFGPSVLSNLPPGLKQLICDHNGLVAITALPATLQDLFCYDNELTTLPPLGNSLDEIHCQNNLMTSLPALPSSLKYLECTNNLLTALPQIPAQLTRIYCENNQLTSIPDLPIGIWKLYCDNNPLTGLPDLPSGMGELSCNSTTLTELPALPTLLGELYCNDNQLTALPPLPNAYFSKLECSNNLLIALPALSNTLQTVRCSNNLLTSLPPLPDTLYTLDCGYNLLTSLPPLPTMGILYCPNNQLASLPALPATLNRLDCSNNMLAELPALPVAFYQLYVHNNPDLMCLPPFEKFIGSGMFDISGTGITCLPNVVQHTGPMPFLDAMPICGIFGNGCEVAWNIAGSVFRDDGADCVNNGTEPPLNNIKLELLQGGIVQQQVYANAGGFYSFNTDLSGYEVRVDTLGLPFVVECPANNLFSSSPSPLDSLDFTGHFALACKPGHDVAVQSVVQTGGMFFPIQEATVTIAAGDLVSFYGATCNTAGISGTASATFTGPVSVVSASGNGFMSGNTITWTVNDLSQVNFFNDFSVVFLTDTFPSAGSQVCMTVTLMANSGTDNNPLNNTLTQCFNVVNSFDPNFKEVFPTVVEQPGDWHTYTVHFQNTGTAPAIHILVKDTLDQNLNWSSFQLLSYSHDNLTQVLNDGIVHFNFPNINLPDSNSNEPDSHGWIQYKIKTDSTITPGTIIHNTAAIYFDFNDPVITNDALVTYCTPVETQQTFTICEGDSVNVNNQWLHQGGVYTNLYTASTGCDSTVTTTLVVNPTVAFIENYTLCPGDSVTVNGQVYHQAVTFTDTTFGTNGCDVLLITNIVESSVTATVALNNDTLAAATGMESYQWIDCDAGQNISGATAQIFAPTQNGHYAVMVTANDACTETSDCIEVVVTGIVNVASNAFTITPNPASQIAVVRTHRPLRQGELRITDLTGRTVHNTILGDTETRIDLNGLVEGTYLMQLLEYGKPVSVQKLAVMQ